MLATSIRHPVRMEQPSERLPEQYTKISWGCQVFSLEHSDIIDYLEKIVGAQIHVRNIKDIIEAFETDIHKISGKTIMIWDK